MLSFIFKLQGKVVREAAVAPAAARETEAAPPPERRLKSHFKVSPEGREVAALAADDFLRDGRASGLC